MHTYVSVCSPDIDRTENFTNSQDSCCILYKGASHKFFFLKELIRAIEILIREFWHRDKHSTSRKKKKQQLNEATRCGVKERSLLRGTACLVQYEMYIYSARS